MIFKFYVSVLFVLSGIYNVCRSQESALDRFTGAESNGRVFLEWVISSGRTCQGIRILRSTDSLNFSQIGDIGGVCGSITVPTRYTFTDDLPVKNKINYYQLELGGIGFSSIVTIKVIDFSENAYQIIPHPAKENVSILISNDTKLFCQLNLYNSGGKFLSSHFTNSNEFKLDKSYLQSGLLFFTISCSGSSHIIKGKVLVFN